MSKIYKVFPVLFGITFFISGLIINFIELILYLTLRPCSKYLYRKINYYFCYSIYSQVLFITEWISGTDCVFYVDKDDYQKYFGKEHAYCLMNHSFEVDWMMLQIFADRNKCFGNYKAYAKKSLRYLPVLGWNMFMSDFVFLERSFDKDREIIVKQTDELWNYSDNVWMLVFPEGTRFTQAKHKSSLEYARKNNLPELKHHLLPRSKGFIASYPSLRRNNVPIYDMTVEFTENERPFATVSSFFSGKSIKAHMYIRRIPCENIPSDDKEIDKFLKDLYVSKDKLRESFHQTGDFFATSGVKKVPGFMLQRRYRSLVNVIFWNSLVLPALFALMIKWLLTGSYILFGTSVGIIYLIYYGLNKMIGMSKLTSASSYGINANTKNKTL